MTLASTSIYRKRLLEQMGLEFTVEQPSFDETPFKAGQISPMELAQKMARGKAQSCQTKGTLILASDQVASLEGKVLSKPGTAEKAAEQLSQLQGKTHFLYTAVCLIANSQIVEWVETAELQMKRLTLDQINRYIQKDQPVDCAGSYKIEKSGITLFESVKAEDWNSIQGLPLIRLAKELTKLGLPLP